HYTGVRRSPGDCREASRPRILDRTRPISDPHLSRPDAAAHFQGASYATVLQAVPGSAPSLLSGPHTGAGLPVGSALDGARPIFRQDHAFLIFPRTPEAILHTRY
ncbi:hypothetical protein MTO96_033965, partial [Rhipicephalus appendiculatus]